MTTLLGIKNREDDEDDEDDDGPSQFDYEDDEDYRNYTDANAGNDQAACCLTQFLSFIAACIAAVVGLSLIFVFLVG